MDSISLTVEIGSNMYSLNDLSLSFFTVGNFYTTASILAQ